ncbi:hypothetical protein [Antarcticirhabdus aurantiaca]|uniref:Uncharacterized protein n=1 Tax=Antarcticirhabdus aurantiaca TaxID=2606717 RepID=A0ACD4NL10_9HYPH|nr:hypothetical protein [Antarcticirhabdus aurantiaca]WAJ27534.1 hypothetical protein OXU80_22235 [Jeongeuplla avenae]
MTQEAKTPRRLIDAEVKDARQIVYYLDDHDVVAVLDRDIVLEASGYEIDREAGTIRVLRRPAGQVRLLVS